MSLFKLIRHSKPNKYDQAPQGSLCKVVTALSSEYDIYEQISSNTDEPVWELIETFNKDSSHS